MKNFRKHGNQIQTITVNNNNRPVSAGQGENMPRLTKAAALAKAGYVPVIGRPTKEPTVPISFRLPVSKAVKLGSKPHKKAREIVERELGGS